MDHNKVIPISTDLLQKESKEIEQQTGLINQTLSSYKPVLQENTNQEQDRPKAVMPLNLAPAAKDRSQAYVALEETDEEQVGLQSHRRGET